jgi:L-ascorbate metabolism protein UlaG (beta-lactamase superfamily)
MVLDWWQSQRINNTQLVFTQAQHCWFTRGLFDLNENLWRSWSQLSLQINLHFARDLGYALIYQNLAAKQSIAIHWGSFVLADEAIIVTNRR